MENKAQIDFDFKKGFFLEEDDILKIDEIIKSRFNSLPNPILKYRIRRSDSNEYTTDILDIILKEENCKAQEIVSLTFMAESNREKKVHEYESDYRLKLSFSKKDGTNLNIEGLDRDLVFLLKSDIKNYLDNNVNKGFSIKDNMIFRLNSMLFLMAFLFIFLLGILFFKSSPTNNKANILKSIDVNEKLNYIIQQSSDFSLTSTNSTFYIIVAFMMLFTIGLTFDFLPKLLGFIFPSNTFYIGKIMKVYDKKISLRNNIFWIVGIGLIVGIIASFVANRL